MFVVLVEFYTFICTLMAYEVYVHRQNLFKYINAVSGIQQLDVPDLRNYFIPKATITPSGGEKIK